MEKIIEAYSKYIYSNPSDIELEALEHFVNVLGIDEDLLVRIIKEAVFSNARTLNYINGIVRNCLNDEILTVEDFERSKQERRNKHCI